MRTSLHTLLYENPFEVLGLFPDSSPRDVRRKLEEQELEATLENDRDKQLESVKRAAHLLEDPQMRLECEILSKWQGSALYGDVAEDHDYAVDTTRQALKHDGAFDPNAASLAISGWAGTFQNTGVREALQNRAMNLGSGTTAPLSDVLSGDVLPALARATISARQMADPRVVLSLVACGTPSKPALSMLVDHAEEAANDEQWVDGLSMRELENLIDSVDEASEIMEPLTPDLADRMMSALASAINRTAWVRVHKGNLATAKSLFESLLESDLPEASRVEAESDLATIRTAIGSNEERTRTATAAPPGRASLANMTVGNLIDQLNAGARYVVFEYCISLLVVTFRRRSDVEFVPAGENAAVRGIGYTLMTLALGWWGIPWGPIYTLGALITNLGGGRNVTAEMVSAMNPPIIRGGDGRWRLA